ncbi:small integral membrane protein 29 isoform X2 [Salvelinus sp. IW2-2015]|uniref:small integral membrane protein 29-like n=1 Tax=Salvelinus alpinus TaxID=8036 RepID=UPI000CEA850C|nr:uncharacterized protein C3orf18-like isoform X2 [Salvelinus alpinus]
MDINSTSPDISTPDHGTLFPVYYVLIPFTGFTLIGCVIALVVYIRRKIKQDRLHHVLIPQYSHDPSEYDQHSEEDWGHEDRDEDEEEMEPLYMEGKLSFNQIS